MHYPRRVRNVADAPRKEARPQREKSPSATLRPFAPRERQDCRLACCGVGRRRRYDDINLTCTRAHCYDNVFKCQPHEWPAWREQARALSRVRAHATASARVCGRSSVGRRRGRPHARAAMTRVTSAQRMIPHASGHNSISERFLPLRPLRGRSVGFIGITSGAFIPETRCASTASSRRDSLRFSMGNERAGLV